MQKCRNMMMAIQFNSHKVNSLQLKDGKSNEFKNPIHPRA